MSDRITLDMNILAMLMALTGGHPGAVSVCLQIVKNTEVGGLVDLLRLDSEGIYGCNIWIAYKDICGEDIAKMQAMLRSGELKTALEANPEYQYYKEKEGV